MKKLVFKCEWEDNGVQAGPLFVEFGGELKPYDDGSWMTLEHAKQIASRQLMRLKVC
jgi:hypothetical protein